jgi:hypothetical protein
MRGYSSSGSHLEQEMVIADGISSSLSEPAISVHVIGLGCCGTGDSTATVACHA